MKYTATPMRLQTIVKVPERTSKLELRNKIDENFTNNADIVKLEFSSELSKCRDRCPGCKIKVQRLRNLLFKLKAIRDKEKILSKCKYCKKYNPLGKCQRCKYIFDESRATEVKRREELSIAFLKWCDEANMFLQSFLEDLFIEYKIKPQSVSVLEKILNQLTEELAAGALDKRSFPEETNLMKNINEIIESLQEFITHVKTEHLTKDDSSKNNLNVSSTKSPIDNASIYAITQKAKEHVVKRTTLLQGPLQINVPEVAITAKSFVMDTENEHSTFRQTSQITSNNYPTIFKKDDEDIIVSNKYAKWPKQKHSKNLKQFKDHITKKEGREIISRRAKLKKSSTTSDELFIGGKFKFPHIPELPEVKIYPKYESMEDVDDSIIVCRDKQSYRSQEMIKGNQIVPLDIRNKSKEKREFPKPLLFKTNVHCLDNVSFQQETATTDHMEKTDGIIIYQLSDPKFIEKGWTKLPTKKIARRMNIFKMVPANPKYDWFKHNKHREALFYRSGEKLTEVLDDGRGKWYYKNGLVALEYFGAIGRNAGPQYIIYSSKEGCRVLACFDCVGNGIVYDNKGKMRLKYNQSEGIVLDKKIGPPSHWKWHMLNEPPVLQPLYIETYDKSRGEVVQNLSDDKEDEQDAISVMLALELEHLFKEREAKLIQKYKPFQIRIKAVKINEQFSLRIIDQANIYLRFRDGPVSLKLSLGTLLMSNEIIDTITSEDQVSTPFDSYTALFRSK